MADRRRRRPSEGESEDENEETVGTRRKEGRPSECESEGEVHGDDNSEYESANEDNDEEEDDSDDEDDDDDDEDDETATYDGSVIIEEDYDGLVDEERQSGDGEEQPSEDVDDDEDRKNPAFVPRRGAFYEHDMRISMEESTEDDKRPKKKLWKDDGKWIHDRFREDMQAPKSREELIAMYGYDIRQYDKPPDAPKMNNRPRGRRIDQKSSLRDFVPNRANRQGPRRSPQNDFVESRNNYNEQDRDNRSERYNNYRDKGHIYNNDNDNRSFHRSSSNELDEDRFSGGQERGYSRGQDRGHDRGHSDRQDRGYSSNDNRYGNSALDKGDFRYEQNQNRQRPERDTYRYERRERGGTSNRASLRGRGRRGRTDDRSSRSYSDMRDNLGGSRGGRKFPPRFQKQAREYGINDDYGYHEGELFRTVITTEPATKVIDTTVKEPTPGPVPQQTQEDLDKENVQNINIVISNSGERKSYSKDRRARDRAVGKTRVQDNAVNCVNQGIMQMNLQSPDQTAETEDSKPQQVPSKQAAGGTSPKSLEQKQNYNKAPKSAASKQSDQNQQGRSKRYSSQRQRPGAEAGYSDQAPPPTTYPDNKTTPPPPPPQNNPKFFKPGAFVKPESPGSPSYQSAMLQPPMTFSIPVSTGGLPSQPPQVFVPPRATGPPPPVTMSTTMRMQPPQFINTGMIYGAPPAPFPVAPGLVPMQGFPSPPAVSTAQPPPPPPPAQQVQTQPQEVYRGGTTYYPPELQKFKSAPMSGTTYYPPELQFKSPHRSPVRRPKAAIPIVDPQAVKKDRSHNESDRIPDLPKSPGSPSTAEYSDARSEEYVDDEEEYYMEEDPLAGTDTNSQQTPQPIENLESKNLANEISEEKPDTVSVEYEDPISNTDTTPHEQCSNENIEVKHSPTDFEEKNSSDLEYSDRVGLSSEMQVKQEPIESKELESIDSVVHENQTSQPVGKAENTDADSTSDTVTDAISTQEQTVKSEPSNT